MTNPLDPPAAPLASLSRGQRLYLYFTAAVTGAAVMIVEILGAKMLAPYVGTSHFVWTVQIAVTLAGLASGYYIGGKLADASPRPGWMYGAILAAAAYLCVSVLVVEPVTYWCLKYELALGSLLASLFLYFLPLLLLAMTGPFFIRVLTVAVSGVGGNVGRLSAVGTFGSFGGTVLIGYVLIPYFRNSMTMCLTAAALVAVCLIYFLFWGRQAGTIAATVYFIAIGTMASLVGLMLDGRGQFGEFTETYRTNSNFGQLQVVERTYDEAPGKKMRYRCYLNDFLTQNTYDPDKKQSVSMFSYMLQGLAWVYTPQLDDVLCIGMGIGIVPRELARGGARVDVVEINAAVVPVAENYFDFDPRQVNITIGDGRQYVNATQKQYDAIVLDAFLGDSSPSHLMSREAFAAMKRTLRPGGVLVINAFCDFRPGKDFYGGSLDKTLKAVFKSVKIHASGNGNTFYVASDQTDLHMWRDPDLAGVHDWCEFEVKEAFDGTVTPNPASGIVLTDDYNPIEFYDAANREEYRKIMADVYRRVK